MQLFRSILSRRMLALILCAILIYVNAFTSVKVFAKVCTNQPAFRCTANKQAEADQAHNNNLAITAKAAVLIDNASGRILYAKNKDKKLIPASITKIMTLLLIFESIEQGKCKLEDKVTVSEYAASMGGSQVFLEPGETQDVNTMIKCISIASANDAAVAMAEHLAGSEQSFVKRMNKKAKALGMKHTHFKNCNGLDDSIESGHYSSAYDVALMSQSLVSKYPDISKYSTVWMDAITHITKKGKKKFGLTNTNKLIRTYQGITGLKPDPHRKQNIVSVLLHNEMESALPPSLWLLQTQKSGLCRRQPCWIMVLQTVPPFRKIRTISLSPRKRSPVVSRRK